MTHACKSACKNDGSYTHACASGDDTSTARAIEPTPRLTLIRPQPDGAAAPSRLPGGATGPNAVAMTVRVPEEVVAPTSAPRPSHRLRRLPCRQPRQSSEVRPAGCHPGSGQPALLRPGGRV